MISRSHPFLGWALVISITLHALVIAAPAWRGKWQSPAPLTVSLREPPAAPEPRNPAPDTPRLILPEKKPRQSAVRPAPEPVARQTATLQRLSGPAARMAGEQMARELLYPVEAIERGLQGEALVLLFLDASGNAVAARLEESSGHALLDDAAVRAARTLRTLPSSAPREALLPVRFRLR
jgi:periplasmic protein TonB